MRVVIVSRDLEVIGPLVDLLSRKNFKVKVVENIAGVQSCLQKGGIQFLLAEPSLLVERNLGREVLKRCPLARLLALAAQPSLLEMVRALSNGLADYFPRSPEYFDQVLEVLVAERRRLLRWKRILLSESAKSPGQPSPAPDRADGSPSAEMSGLSSVTDAEPPMYLEESSPRGLEYEG